MGSENAKKNEMAKPKRYKSVLLYLLFVLISFLFWCFLNLSRSADYTLPIRIELVNVPQNVTFIDPVPSTITVSVKGRGADVLRSYYFIKDKALKIDFSVFSNSENDMFNVSNAKLKMSVQKMLGNGLSLVDVDPSVLSAKFTSLPGKKVPVRVDLDVMTNLQYAISGMVDYSCDSVMVYSDKATLSTISEVYTYHVNVTDLKDTLRREMLISPIRNAKVVPNKIDVVVPVEPLIAKKKNVVVEVRNAPKGINVLLFPSMVEVSCLVPKSRAKDDNSNSDKVTAIVDYNSINRESPTNKAPVVVGESPAAYKNVRVSVDSVEYLIEKE